MASEPQDGGPCVNTDRHLWPDVSEPGTVHESIHVTAQGAIGINVGGYVYVKPLREWHQLAGGTEGFQPVPMAVHRQPVVDIAWRIVNSAMNTAASANSVLVHRQLIGELREALMRFPNGAAQPAGDTIATSRDSLRAKLSDILALLRDDYPNTAQDRLREMIDAEQFREGSS